MIIYEEQNEKIKISISIQGKVFLLSGGYEKQYIKEKVNPMKKDLLTGFNVFISAATILFSVYTLIGYESKLESSQLEIKEIRKELNRQTLEVERAKNNESRMTNPKQNSEIHYYIFPHNSSTHTKIDSIAAQN